MLEYLLILFVILCTAWVGFKLRFLNISGSVAAFVVGLLIVLGFHVKGLLLLGVFFATSSFWSHYKRRLKNKVEERHEKGSARDWQQVLANGGMAAFISMLYYVEPHPEWIVSFSILLASSNSDTWASEIGTLSKRAPISVRHFKKVEKGTSGAVSVLGTLAALTGSFLIASVAYFLFSLDLFTMFFIFIFGFLGNSIDTLLGAFLQAEYRCKVCGIETERLQHCGVETEHMKGLEFLNNDLVNFLSSVMAASIGGMIYYFMRY